MLYFTIQNRLQAGTSKVSEAAGARWRFYRRISSDYGRIVFLLAEALQGFSAQILTFKISWQAQYLVRLEGDLTGSAHWKWRFICDADHWWHWFCVAGAIFGEVGGSFCVAGAVFGEVGGWLFVTGAALGDILGDSRDAKYCILQYKIVSKLGRVRSPKRRVRDDDFIVGYPRIILGLWSNRLSIGGSTSGIFRANLDLQDFVAGAVFGEVGGWLDWLRALEMTFHMWRRSLMRFILRGRRSIWWGWRVTLLAARIGNDDSYVMLIIDDIDFVWQAQYLVRLAGDFSWRAQHFVTFWEIAGTRNVVFYNTKSSPRSDREGPRSGGCEMTISCSDYGRIVFLSAEAIQGFSVEMLTSEFRGRRSIRWGWRVTWLAPRIGNDVSYVSQITSDIHFAWQAQYLVRLDADCILAPRIGNDVSYVTQIIDDIHFAWQA